MRFCPTCRQQYEPWTVHCIRCGTLLVDKPARNGEATEVDNVVSVELTLRSGESIEVRETMPGPADEHAIRTFAEQLAADLGKDKVRIFSYWWGGQFFTDAVRMDEVVAFSVSAATEEEEEYEEGE